jgi:predicted RNA-binding protein YlxR (DUF448 family)
MKTPIRTCVGCGAKRPKNEMIRVGLDREGKPGITSPGKHAGRGSYICADVECLRRAKQNRGLPRVLRKDVPAGMYESLELEIGDRQKVRSG